MKKALPIIVLGLFVILGLLIALVSCIDDEKEEVGPAPQTFEEHVVAFIHKELKAQTNFKTERIDTMEFKDGTLALTLNGDDNLSSDWIRSRMWTQSVEALEGLFNFDEVEVVKLTWLFPLTDTYGNKNDTEVMMITLRRETAEKIIWSNFLDSNLPKVTDNYWEHPVFSN